MNVTGILRELANRRPNAPALIDPRSGTLTFSGMEAASARAAGLLWASGVRPGDAVLVFHPMAAELYVALLALFRLNVTAIFIDPGAGLDHIERCCRQYPPQAFIGSTKAHLLRAFSPALRSIPLKFVIGPAVPGAIRWNHSAQPQEPVPASPDTPALLTFTSGSTGTPKVIARSHDFLLAQHRVLNHTLRFAPGDIVLAALPMFVLSHLASGVASVVPDADLRHPAAADPDALVRQIDDCGITGMELPPCLLQRITAWCSKTGRNLPAVRNVYAGGAPVFPPLLQQAVRVMPNAAITSVYGSSEAEPIAHISREEISPEDSDAMASGRGILAGPPVSAIQLRILPDRWGEPLGPYTAAEFDAACLPPGQCGEIVVSGDHVLQHYLNNECDNLIKFRAGDAVWHRTGDAGYLDAQGRLWLLGRSCARVTDQRGTLYPLSVECAASGFPAIHRLAFVRHDGRRILAVELRSSFPAADLEALKLRLAWAGIDEVLVLRHIPVDKRHNSKIDYPALEAELARHGQVRPERRALCFALSIAPPAAPGRTRASSSPAGTRRTSSRCGAGARCGATAGRSVTTRATRPGSAPSP
jgi:olefin beta-lactone synthetase